MIPFANENEIFLEKGFILIFKEFIIFLIYECSGGQGYTGKFQGMDNESYAFYTLHKYRFYSILIYCKKVYFNYVTFTK